MMYNNKLAVALKSNGKVLREFRETVYVPFGSEYSILIKNLNSVRALVTVTVDGIDAGDGRQFVIDPHIGSNSLELERFLKNGNMNKGNRFKFIERTDNIEKHRGVGIEDGLVRIEFQFEKPAPVIRPYYSEPHLWYSNDSDMKGSMRGLDKLKSMNTAGPAVVAGACAAASDSFELAQQSVKMQANDAGITVPGSVSNQKFSTVSSFPVEDTKHVIVLQMLGETEDNKQVVKPVTVKAKPKCTTCGRTNKATAKFCTECGTSLTIV